MLFAVWFIVGFGLMCVGLGLIGMGIERVKGESVTDGATKKPAD